MEHHVVDGDVGVGTGRSQSHGPNADAQTETNLYSFGSSPNNGPEGQSPYAGLIQGSDGNFYGRHISGGTNFNRTWLVFEISQRRLTPRCTSSAEIVVP